ATPPPSILFAFRHRQFVGGTPRSDPRHDALVRHEPPGIAVRDTLVDRRQLPRLQFDKFADSLLDDPRFRAIEHGGNRGELVVQLRFQPEAYRRRLGHESSGAGCPFLHRIASGRLQVRQQPPGGRRVGGNLGLQLVEAGEFALGADEVVERDAQVAAVEVAVDVEKMRLEPRAVAADGGPEPDIGDAVDGAAVERVVRPVAADPHGIDPEGGAQVFAEPDIGGGEAEQAAAPVADRDAAVDLPGAAELGGGLARPALAQQFADMGRGIDRRVGAAHRIDDADAEAVHRPRLLQHRGGAAAAVAEGAVVADDDMADADGGDHDLLDEGFGAFLGEGGVEMLDEQQID